MTAKVDASVTVKVITVPEPLMEVTVSGLPTTAVAVPPAPVPLLLVVNVVAVVEITLKVPLYAAVVDPETVTYWPTTIPVVLATVYVAKVPVPLIAVTAKFRLLRVERPFKPVWL